MRLNEVQKKFTDMMLDHPDALNAPGQDFAALFETGGIALPERLKVYRNNIVGSLTGNLRASFPAVDDLTGKEFFDVMARSYILANPPREGNLNGYGSGFDDFIRTYTPAQTLPYLTDVANLEIGVNEAYYAKDDTALTAEILAKIPPEILRLTPRASMRLVQSAYPVSAIREFCLNKNRSENEQLDIGTDGEKLMIFRPEFEIVIARMQDDEFAFMTLLQTGNGGLGPALEKILQQHPNFNFQAFLQRHIALGSFTAP
jgi:hypothetical protein